MCENIFNGKVKTTLNMYDSAIYTQQIKGWLRDKPEMVTDCAQIQGWLWQSLQGR